MARGQKQTESQGGGSESTSSTPGGTGTAFGTESGREGNGGASEYGSETRQSRQGNGPGRQLERTGRRGGLQTTRGWPGLLGGAIAASPWELVRRMTEEMNQLFESLGGTGAGPVGTVLERRRTAGTAPLLVPRTEVIQQPDALLVRVDLPGLAPDEIDVTVEDGLLTITGERQQQDVQEGEGFIRSELTYGTFLRTIPLPAGADEENIQAVCRNGMLEIRVPIEKREQGRRVTVQADQSDRSEVRPNRSQAQSGGSDAQSAGSQAQSSGSEASRT